MLLSSPARLKSSGTFISSAVIPIKFAYIDSICVAALASELDLSGILAVFVGAFSISSSLKTLPTVAGVQQ